MSDMTDIRVEDLLVKIPFLFLFHEVSGSNTNFSLISM